jgi:hypothetical protein
MQAAAPQDGGRLETHEARGGVCPPVRGTRYAAGGGGGGFGGLGGAASVALAAAWGNPNSTHSITSSARASSVGGTVPVTNTAAHRNFRAQAAAKREQLLAQLA